MAPTFLDIAGVKVPEHMDGNSMLPLLKSQDLESEKSEDRINNLKIEWRDSFLIEKGYDLKQRFPNGGSRPKSGSRDQNF